MCFLGYPVLCRSHGKAGVSIHIKVLFGSSYYIRTEEDCEELVWILTC
ncbi:hypothetical protein Zm00014a_032236 [Zea mays]|uniref:Uncharacterized protein n=1 Tax=Zea mays TaxID=4577 RepID=A0A3L6F9I8_MAIZE|nr:hypothetical protein Zm00014a_032236 [Zea mays]